MSDRIALAALTGDDLDALYDRLDELEQAEVITAQVMDKADEDTNGAIETARYFKALAEQAQAWGEQHRDRANRYRARTDAVRAELTALNGETVGLNPYAMAGRRDAVARVRAALQSISHDTPVPDDPRITELQAAIARVRQAAAKDVPLERFMGEEPTEYARGWAAATALIDAALDRAQPPASPPAHLAKDTNAEDCPACKGTNPPYPFLCPGPSSA